MIRNIRVITAASFAAMLFLGIGSALIGAAARDIGLTPEQIGFMLAVQNVGFGVAVAATGALSDTHPKARLLLFGSLVLGAAFLAFYAWPGFLLNLLVMAFIGVGTGVYEGVTDALLFDLHTARAGFIININHLFVTLGSATIALYLLFLASQWRMAVIQAGAAVLLLAAFFARVHLPVRPGHQPGLREKLGIVARSRLIAVLFIGTIVAVGGEGTTIGVLTTYLAQTRGLSALHANIGLVIFLLGIAAGRLLIGVLARPHRIRRLLLALFALSSLALTLYFVVDFGPFIWPATLLAGLSVSALLPLILAYAGLAFPHMAGTVMGAVKIAIPVGGILTALLLSALTALASFETALLAMPAGLFLGLLLLAWLSRTQPASAGCVPIPGQQAS
ncbi:MAG: Major Facilitator Superfamily protein [Chloroflexi bacterium ADurb.Bin325]|nr:MAG: Major Facilitator Superfamily protein [Chloroflexi bacterium ADurb.Bin325]